MRRLFFELIDMIGAQVSEFMLWIGGMTSMLVHVLRYGPRRPFGLNDISSQVFSLGMQSLGMATFMALFMGMIFAWQFGEAVAHFGATQAIGGVSALALVREIVPTVLALTVGAKMATGMAAELGSMKVTEQIDAIGAMGADPIKKLVWPRIVASTLSLPALVVWGNIVALLGGMIIADAIFNLPAEYFYETYVAKLVPRYYVTGLIKATVFGAIAGIVGCYQGFNTKFGTEAVGEATTETVVAMALSTIVADFALTVVLIPI